MFVSMYVRAVLVCLVPVRARRGCQIPCNWSYRWVRTAKQVLGIEFRYLRESSQCS